MTTRPVHDELVVAVAAYGLRGSRTSLPDTPLDAPTWERLIDRVRSERLAGHLVDAVMDGALPVTREQRQEAVELHTTQLWWSLLLDRRLLATASALQEASIDYRVLKGTAVAHTVYPEPSLRLFGDVDLLVRAPQFDQAAAVLVSLGARRSAPALRAGFDRRFGKGAGFVFEDQLEVDLHRTLVLGYFGLLVDVDALFDHPATFRIGGRDLPALRLEERFLNACYHAVLGHHGRLVSCRDVAQFVLETPLDMERALAVARRWSGEAVVARAVHAAWETFDLADVVPLSVWASRYQPTRHEERAMHGYIGSRRSEAVRALVAVRAVGGLRGKATFLRSLVLADRAYLDWTGQGRLAWLRRGRRALHRARP
ncbi:MAG TPA: nucleotidyltransferase family protein [Nitriliruptorales bacterium]|nr:nucleotidyltransferase family protein [Nitriliruptorales bacterium]